MVKISGTDLIAGTKWGHIYLSIKDKIFDVLKVSSAIPF